MAMSNAERQRKWREKNRALFNYRRRSSRKCDSLDARSGIPAKDTIGLPQSQKLNHGASTPPARSSSKVEELRALIEEEHAKPVEAGVVPLVYRDDFGRVISERQWKRLNKMKEDAKEGGYEIDEYSQST